MAAQRGTPCVRILVADPSAGYRHALARLLSHEPVEIVGEAKDTVELSLAVERLRPDVILLDPELPGVDGLHAVPKLGGLSPEPAVIFLRLVGGKMTRRSAHSRRPSLAKELADRMLLDRILEAARSRSPA